ncbi:hypothetical protein QTG54_003683 [Skeletonema marinoi]|uniref:Uncharacterized protein n=1 Tax=Skeletonema marinoi TaxID=267567 RepID=A0AAD8YHR0_9STRA|nr:hypothetical protein QTG54_003683 [Skeletonema marinoi]
MAAMSTSDEDNISRSPSTLFFDEDDSSDLDNLSGPRRRCSFVSNSDRPIMDLRYPASVSGDKSYDLSVCSDNSFSTMQTEDAALEKLGMFEIALAAGYKKQDDESVLIRANTYPDGAKGGWLHKVRMKRHTLDHGVCSSELLKNGSGDNDDSSVVKKSKTSRKKVYMLRCGQAVGIVLLLSSFIVSILFFETSDKDQLSFFAIPVEVTRTMENLFGSSPGQEVEEVEQKKEEERVMVQQPQAMIQEEPPVENHEYEQFFVQAFRNNQKISQRLNKDPMRQRMMIKSGNTVEHSMDKVAQVRIQEFRDNQRLALEGAHLTRRRLNESEEPVTKDKIIVKRELTKSLNSVAEGLDLTMMWFLQVQYQTPQSDGAGGLRKK